MNPSIPVLFGILATLMLQDPGNLETFRERWSVKQLVEAHQRQRPGLQAQDIYKMLYQACFGVGHLLSDSMEVQRYLVDEISSLDSSISSEPLIERISTSGDMVRLNLRPFKELNLDPGSVVQLMFRSAEQTPQDTLRFFREWNEFSALVRFDVLRFPQGDVELWDSRIAQGILMPVHHSEQYSREYKPAYRVVRFALVDSLLRIGGYRE
jgi:hypothetical protein